MSRGPHFSVMLEPGAIRLLRLMPDTDETAPIQCRLFNYSPQELGQKSHLYEALSYVWGDPDQLLPVLINEHPFNITVNLHAALSSLRNHSVERLLWVDAICINQSNQKEKEQQIQSMAKVYGQANRVVVWLGKTADDSDLALEEIRVAQGKNFTNNSDNKRIQQAVLALLQRPWFQRIWVIQEVAAARHVLIMCGPTEVDGYAFCLGLELFTDLYKDSPGLQGLTYLIKGAIFRPRYAESKSGRVSLDICPLGELMDMYHTHKATKCHDKVYALLGMCSDDLSKASLSPDYNVLWKDLFETLARFLLGKEIFVEASPDKEIAVFKSSACILGKVSSVQNDIGSNGGQDVVVILRNILGTQGYTGRWSSHWTLHPSAKPVVSGDVICLAQGASKPTIIRFCEDHWAVIIVAATPPQTVQIGKEDVEWSKVLESAKLLRPRNLELIWDWGISPGKLQGQEEYGDSEGCLDKVIRLWYYALVLGDMEEYGKAEEKFHEAMEGYETAFGKEHTHNTVAKRLPLANSADQDLMNSKYSRPPLLWAAERGHEAVVELLLRTDKKNVNLKDRGGQTPLIWAAVGGHLAVVERLLEEKANVNAEAGDYSRRTALQAAAEGGYLAVVERLLQEKADVNAKAGSNSRKTALQAAAGGGHLAVVERLLQEKADVNAKAVYNSGRTALQAAAGGGYLAVVERLLQEKADVNAAARYNSGRTALQAAAGGGYLVVVERLLQEKADVNAEAGYNSGRTALQAAAGGGHLAVVERLLQEKANVNAEAGDYSGRTALQAAAGGGHKTIVNRLRRAGAQI